MKKIAIAYASKHGQTEKIARYLAAKIESRKMEYELIDTSRSSVALGQGFSGIIYGSPVYRGRFPSGILAWARKNSVRINALPSAFFTVSLNAADQRPAARVADQQLLTLFMQETAALPRFSASFAGALNFRQYWWPIRLLMKRISAKAGGSTDTSRDHEYTDWQKVDSFLARFLVDLESRNPVKQVLIFPKGRRAELQA